MRFYLAHRLLSPADQVFAAPGPDGQDGEGGQQAEDDGSGKQYRSNVIILPFCKNTLKRPAIVIVRKILIPII